MKAAFSPPLLFPLAFVLIIAGGCEPVTDPPKQLLANKTNTCDTCGIVNYIIGTGDVLDTAQRIIGTGDVLDTASISLPQNSWIENTPCFEKRFYRNDVYELHTTAKDISVTDIETGRPVYLHDLTLIPAAVCMDLKTFAIIIPH